MMFSFKDEEFLYECAALKQHGIKVMTYFDNALQSFEDSNPDLVKLGERHQGRGITAPHYEVVGGALLKTLKDALGNDFNDELKEAWLEVYVMITRVMKGENKEPDE